MLSNEEIEKAEKLGATKAKAELRFTPNAEPGEPLSGEWSGDLTPRGLFAKVTGRAPDYDGSDENDIDELAEVYEGAYFDGFTKVARAA